MDEKFSIRRFPAILAVLMVLVMTVLDVTIVNVALPVLAIDFDISPANAVWLITLYQLVITMLLLPASAFGDRFSYRASFLTGTLLFTVSSLSCACSPTFEILLISRGFQGIGAALVMGVNIALTRLIYPRKLLGRGMALNAMVIAVSTAAGPTIAGSLLSAASWHWLFLINIPFGLAAFFIGRAKLPRNPSKPSGHFDWRSALENMVTFGLIFFALGMFARKGDWRWALVLLISGLICGLVYIRHQLRIEQPMLPVDLFRSKLFSLSILTSVSSFIAQNVAMIALPFLFHNRYGFSEVVTGLLMTPWSLATMVVSPLAARWVETHNPERTAACGMGVYALGVVMLLILPSEGADVWQIAWRMMLCGIGFGMFQTPNNIVMVIATPIRRSGSAGGMQSTARLVGQTLGATAVTLVFALAAGRYAIEATLCVALLFALTAGIFSITRRTRAGVED